MAMDLMVEAGELNALPVVLSVDVARQLDGATGSPVAWGQVSRPISVDAGMMAPG